MSALLGLLFIGGGDLARAQSGAEREYAIKAAFLYHFFSFVDWPEADGSGAGDTYSIAILGDDPFGRALSVLSGKTVKGRRLVVDRVQRLDDANRYQLVFISASEENRLSEVLEKIGTSSVLTVSEISDFTRRGGMINLVARRNKVLIEVNPDAAQRAGLSISSQLLKLAKIVKS